jgi:hypothetical protein
MAFLSQIAAQSGNQSKENIIPFLLSAGRNAKEMGIDFSDSETDMIMNVLKNRMSPAEQQRMETFRMLAHNMSNMNNSSRR